MNAEYARYLSKEGYSRNAREFNRPCGDYGKTATTCLFVTLELLA
jgi:hypothetical protein